VARFKTYLCVRGSSAGIKRIEPNRWVIHEGDHDEIRAGEKRAAREEEAEGAISSEGHWAVKGERSELLF